ncbi:hypothetical protein BJ508DRAFT_330009 [Ascobolus immersus RN42]|uniref:Uncharacterized protein n=1 Tax=Ascobolus immersus RN42 TaxID=1160509 RepID=A0A3N4HWZ4_ASCIM|nr:hypothetical protein BJ508DRAFT_330009 [Ascobolus immersus RN42]
MFSFWKSTEPTTNKACSEKDTKPSSSKPESSTEWTDICHEFSAPHLYITSRTEEQVRTKPIQVLYTYNQLLLNELENKLLYPNDRAGKCMELSVQLGRELLPRLMKAKKRFTKWAVKYEVLEGKVDEWSEGFELPVAPLRLIKEQIHSDCTAADCGCTKHVQDGQGALAVEDESTADALVRPFDSEECLCRDPYLENLPESLQEFLLLSMMEINVAITSKLMFCILAGRAYMRDMRSVLQIMFTTRPFMTAKPLGEFARGLRFFYAVGCNSTDLLDVDDLPTDPAEFFEDDPLQLSQPGLSPSEQLAILQRETKKQFDQAAETGEDANAEELDWADLRAEWMKGLEAIEEAIEDLDDYCS